jgi:hypothetical protein
MEEQIAKNSGKNSNEMLAIGKGPVIILPRDREIRRDLKLTGRRF